MDRERAERKLETVRNPIPIGVSPEDVLRHAARILRSQPGYMREFLEMLDVKIMLLVDYESGEEQHWAGPPEDWAAHVREYEIDADDIGNWDLMLGRFLISSVGHPVNNALEPSRESMKFLRAEGWAPPLPKRKRREKRP